MHMKMDFQSLGKSMRVHRVACGLNQTELAKILSCYQQDVSLTECGKRRPKAPMMNKILTWLKTSPETVRLQKYFNEGAARKG